MRKNVFVIIVTFNGDRWIKDTIQSLFKSKYFCRIVVIDNGSSDKTLEILSGFKEIKLIDNNLNLGFGQANNIGIEYSQKNSIPLLARGGGSSQCGQTVGECIVLDYSKYQNKILEFNAKEKFVWVEHFTSS